MSAQRPRGILPGDLEGGRSNFVLGQKFSMRNEVPPTQLPWERSPKTTKNSGFEQIPEFHQVTSVCARGVVGDFLWYKKIIEICVCPCTNQLFLSNKRILIRVHGPFAKSRILKIPRRCSRICNWDPSGMG